MTARVAAADCMLVPRQTARSLVQQNLRFYAEMATWRAVLASVGY